MDKTRAHNLISQAGFGLTAAGAIGAYCICLCAVFNQGVIVALTCAVLFTLASVKRGAIYTPSPLLAVSFFLLLQLNSLPLAIISLAIGCVLCLILSKRLKGAMPPDFVMGGIFIGLALCATILFTNTYFGIGAYGATTLDMLKSYRSLGFHPDFRGLLYGTITLFTMITYPFKFRRLKNIIPAEFITILIPFILNLILNPNAAYTTTNEYFAAEISFSMPDADYATISRGVLSAAAVTGFVLYLLSDKTDSPRPCSVFSAHPAIPCKGTGFTVVSVATAIVTIAGVVLLAPSLVYRLPLPCVGAMLIVSAWQHTSFKPLTSTIKEKSVLKLLLLISCGVAFVIFTPDYAISYCLMLWVITKLIHRRREANK